MGMPISDSEFIGRRRKFVKAGPYIFGFCLAALFCLGTWIYFNQSRLINFVEVARQIEDGSLDQLTVELMAVMLPVAMLMSLVLVVVFIGLCWAALTNEKRYLRIVEELSSQLKHP